MRPSIALLSNFCYEHKVYVTNWEAHLKSKSHKCKLYHLNYRDLCHYTNCMSFWCWDGYCSKHFLIGFYGKNLYSILVKNKHD